MSAQIPVTLQDALDAAMQHKALQGKHSSEHKLAYCLAKVEAYTKGSPLPLAEFTPGWVAEFALWLTEAEGLAANSRATYLRAMYSALRHAAANGAAVDPAAIPAELRANAPATDATASEAPGPQTADAGRANWYAMKCRTVTTAQMAEQLATDYPGTDTFRTEVEKMVATPAGRQRQAVELLRNILFFRTTAATCRRMKYAYHDRAYIYDYASGDTRQMAIVPANDLKVFMYANDIAPDKILYYFPDETALPRISEGVRVRISQGPYQGTLATVEKASTADPLTAIVLITFPGLGIYAKAPIPWRFLQPV